MATSRAAEVLTGEFEVAAPSMRRWKRALILLRDNPLGAFGLVMVLLLIIFAVFAPQIAPYDPDRLLGAAAKDLGPSPSHFFGTDHLGRDMFSRVIYGSRISLIAGFTSVLFGTAVGTVIGIISGYLKGAIDNFIQRTVDTAIAFPALILLLILRGVMGPSLRTIVIAIGIAIIFPVARIMRGAVLSESNNQYVEAARSIGASTPRILFHHLLPNVVALAIIIATTLLGTAILAEAALAFLGIGIPSSITWGQDVSAARNTFPINFWAAFFPGAAITLVVLGFNLLGDSLRDIFDPRLRGRL